MPQEATALLPNSGIAAKRDFISTTAAVSGENDTLNEAFSRALRESQTTLDEVVSKNGPLRGLLPDNGNQLPLEENSIVFPDDEISNDLQIDTAVLIEKEAALALPEKLSNQNLEPAKGDNVALEPDNPGVYSLADQVQQRLGNRQSAGVATQDEVLGRQSNALTKDNPLAVKNSADKLFVEQRLFQDSQIEEPIRNVKLSDELLSPKIALDATKTFMNVSSITNAENTQSVLSLSGGQPLTQQSSDKVLSIFTIDSPLQSREWKEEVGDRVRWLISQKIHSAELKISPPQLGSVDIRINVQNEQVTIQFNAANAMLKETLDESLPRLREILSSNGLDLVDVDVAQHSDRGEGHEENDIEDSDSRTMEDNKLSQHDENEINVDSGMVLRKGIIDMYA